MKKKTKVTLAVEETFFVRRDFGSSPQILGHFRRPRNVLNQMERARGTLVALNQAAEGPPAPAQ